MTTRKPAQNASFETTYSPKAKIDFFDAAARAAKVLAGTGQKADAGDEFFQKAISLTIEAIKNSPKETVTDVSVAALSCATALVKAFPESADAILSAIERVAQERTSMPVKNREENLCEKILAFLETTGTEGPKFMGRTIIIAETIARHAYYTNDIDDAVSFICKIGSARKKMTDEALNAVDGILTERYKQFERSGRMYKEDFDIHIISSLEALVEAQPKAAEGAFNLVRCIESSFDGKEMEKDIENRPYASLLNQHRLSFHAVAVEAGLPPERAQESLAFVLKAARIVSWMEHLPDVASGDGELASSLCWYDENSKKKFSSATRRLRNALEKKQIELFDTIDSAEFFYLWGYVPLSVLGRRTELIKGELENAASKGWGWRVKEIIDAHPEAIDEDVVNNAGYATRYSSSFSGDNTKEADILCSVVRGRKDMIPHVLPCVKHLMKYGEKAEELILAIREADPECDLRNALGPDAALLLLQIKGPSGFSAA